MLLLVARMMVGSREYVMSRYKLNKIKEIEDLVADAVQIVSKILRGSRISILLIARLVAVMSLRRFWPFSVLLRSIEANMM